MSPNSMAQLRAAPMSISNVGLVVDSTNSIPVEALHLLKICGRIRLRFGGVFNGASSGFLAPPPCSPGC